MKAIARFLAAAALAAAVLALGACATSGMGGGELVRKGEGDQPVLFSWKSDDGGMSGTMTARLPDATYRGRFFQITRQTERRSIEPLWNGWPEGWYDWHYWGPDAYEPYAVTQFITRYTGKVVANMRNDDGKRMRCRMHLIAPARGMAGGGEGECQIHGGGTVSARF